jgi:hypothetical protein
VSENQILKQNIENYEKQKIKLKENLKTLNSKIDNNQVIF